MSDYVALRLPAERRAGVTVGSLAHQVLLAVRPAGGMKLEQLYARFPDANLSHTLTGLRRAGLIPPAASGVPGQSVTLTDAGRALVTPAGPLARRATLINYCHL